MQMASVVILARLLSPRDYGLYTTVLIVVGVGEIFRDFGLSSAAIQAAVLTRLQRDNLFWVNTGLGVVLAGLTIRGRARYRRAVRPAVADHDHARTCLDVRINGLATQFRADLNRRLKFGRLAVTNLCGQAVGLVVAIAAAAAGARYWALVASQLAQVGVVLVLVVVFARWLPRRPRRGVPLGSFLRYGWNFVATEVVNYFGNNLDSTIIALSFRRCTARPVQPRVPTRHEPAEQVPQSGDDGGASPSCRACRTTYRGRMCICGGPRSPLATRSSPGWRSGPGRRTVSCISRSAPSGIRSRPSSRYWRSRRASRCFPTSAIGPTSPAA